MVIDADAHVEESVETWSYLESEFYPNHSQWNPTGSGQTYSLRCTVRA